MVMEGIFWGGIPLLFATFWGDLGNRFGPYILPGSMTMLMQSLEEGHHSEKVEQVTSK